LSTSVTATTRSPPINPPSKAPTTVVPIRDQRVTSSAGVSPWMMVKTGSSYLSQSELPLTFGLGQATTITKVEVKWPNGNTETLTGVTINQALRVEEGRGIVARAPLPVARPGTK
jgi:hypothetical protein